MESCHLHGIFDAIILIFCSWKIALNKVILMIGFLANCSFFTIRKKNVIAIFALFSLDWLSTIYLRVFLLHMKYLRPKITYTAYNIKVKIILK